MRDFLVNRLLEASTLRGIVAVAAGLTGYSFSEDQATALVAVALALGGLLKVFLPDRFGAK